MGGWVELYPIFFWIFGIFLTLQSPLVASLFQCGANRLSCIRHACISVTKKKSVFPRNNKVWAHGPMSMKFDGPFL